MTIYTIVSWGCIAAMSAILLYLVVKFFTRTRAEKIEFIKGFKKGKCAIIYLIAIPIFLMDRLYTGEAIAPAIFNSVSKAAQLVVLKYDISFALLQANLVYAAATYLCFSLVILNALMITASILHEHIWQTFRMFLFHCSKKEQCVILGNNRESRLIYRTCKGRAVIADVLKRDAQERLYIEGFSYKTYQSEKRLAAWVQKLIRRAAKTCAHCKPMQAKTRLRIVVNFGDEEKNLRWCGKFARMLGALEGDEVLAVDVYVFGDREYEDVYSRYEANAQGCLHYVNEYQQIAVDFIDRYPLTEFMNERHFDAQTSLLHANTEVNVAMIGFGRTNQQIFLSMVANSQFLTARGGKTVSLPVRYYLFDRLHAGVHKNLNHTAFRYRNDFFAGERTRAGKGEFLPLPDVPSCEEYRELDVNDSRFFENIGGVISRGERAINYLIVSLGSDYESLDVANKLAANVKERGLENVHIFVRIREREVFDDAPLFMDLTFCHPFGTNRGVVYDFAHIIREKFAEMAILRNYVYNIERDMLHEQVTEEQRFLSHRKWFTKLSSSERESNVYACLSLRSKLQLMGLDYCPKDEAGESALSQEEFFAIYAGSDLPEIVCDADGTPRAIRYGIDFRRSRRRTMAIQEHARWNAFMFSKGFLPATKKQILEERTPEGKFTNGKNYALRRHGNLTTYEGLVTFRKMLAQRDGKPEENYDVIKYDYQLLDGAWWLLNESGFAIVRRKQS